MSENDNPGSKEPCGWVKLWHPRGVLTTLPVSGDHLAMVTQYLDRGWLVEAPGLEAGESKIQIGSVVRRSKENKDGSDTIVVDLYPAEEGRSKYPFLTIYLNNEEQIRDFESASSLLIKPIPISQARVERGKSRQTDSFIAKAPKPFTVIWRPNPKHDPNETDTTKKKPARLFVRWDSVAYSGGKKNGNPELSKEDSEQIAMIAGWLAKNSKIDLRAFNIAKADLKNITSDVARRESWALYQKFAADRGWSFDKASMEFVVIVGNS